MKLIIVSGLSGSGKSIALNTLEDSGYYCIDNLPFFLLETFLNKACLQKDLYTKVAIGIDSRNQSENPGSYAALLERVNGLGIDCSVLYLRADLQILINRFSETRRKHPLSDHSTTLSDAIEQELCLMEPVAGFADIVIDTSHMNVHQLRQLIKERLQMADTQVCSIVLESFGFKHGVPPDANYVFDVRCLPNPYWKANLREQTGQDAGVNAFLDAAPDVQLYIKDIYQILQHWVPVFEKENRSYLTVAIGCTGGQHRSVYIVEKLAALFLDSARQSLVRHRELSK